LTLNRRCPIHGPDSTHHRRQDAAPASRPWLHAALIAAAIAVVYSNSLSGPFILDDADTIVTNAAVRDPGDIARVFAQARDTPLAGRPLVAYTFALNYAASGLAVQGYHATNIVIHILCALLLFGLVRRTISVPGSGLRAPGSGDAENVAFAVALVWALHPLNTEVVDYITQRTESMMALCLLASLYAAMRSLTERRTILWQTAAIAACACGMLCKETMVVAPLLIVLYDRAFFFGSLRGAFAVRWRLYGGLALTWLVLLAMMVPGPRAGSVGFGAAITPWEYLLNQAVMIAHYLGLAVWPRGLTVNYGPPLPYRLGDVWPQAALIFGLIAATLAAFQWRAALGFLGAWVFITLAPTSSFVPIATEVGAERRMYLPLMAIAALAHGSRSFRAQPPGTEGHCRHRAASRRRCSAAATASRNRDYATELALAESNLAHWPTDVAHGMVGSALMQLHRHDEALEELRLAARTAPRSRYNLGSELYNLKRMDEAIVELEAFAGENPMDELAPSARRILGDAFVTQRKWEEAVKQYRLALSMIPNDQATKQNMLGAMNNQGLALAASGRFAEAASIFRTVVESDPANLGARRNLTAALLDSQDPRSAETEARKAIEASPGTAVFYDLLGRALATQGRYDEAIVQLREALRLAPEDAEIREDLEKVKTGK
jgi:tetratricopeptide (TPR) repeat protein